MLSIPIAAVAGLLLGLWLRLPTLVAATLVLLVAMIAMGRPIVESLAAWAMLHVFYLLGALWAHGCGRA